MYNLGVFFNYVKIRLQFLRANVAKVTIVLALVMQSENKCKEINFSINNVDVICV